jgi:predicted Fe-Mo cluster-binding NifX family protein
MKICISSLGSDLNSLIDPRFGRAQYFLFLDEKGNLDEVVSNPGILARGGAGITAAQRVANENIDVLITGNIGPNAVRVIGTTKIKIFLCSSNVKIKEVFSMWKNNKLTEVKQSSVPGHFGMGQGMGRGQGPRGPRN